jgi:SAM-dependent methyltransferase
MTQVLYGPDLAHVHDAAFGGWSREAAPFVLARLREAGLDEGLVVDLGCGSGIWAADLLGAGYEVVGVDASDEMLALARRRAPGAELVRGSLHEVVLPPCAAITALGEAVNYGGPSSLDLLFRRAHAALEPDGLLVLDAAAPGREPELHRRARYEGEDWVMHVDADEDREERTLTRRISLVRDGRTSEEVHALRLYEREEVVEWLEAAGFGPHERRVDARRDAEVAIDATADELDLQRARTGVVADALDRARLHR